MPCRPGWRSCSLGVVVVGCGGPILANPLPSDAPIDPAVPERRRGRRTRSRSSCPATTDPTTG